MLRRSLWVFMGVMALGLLFSAGCGNPIKRPPQSVFPGSEEYATRIADFKVTPEQAYTIAHEEALTDHKLQFVSKKPTAVYKRWYIFSMPQATGANLHGYHVHGDTGEVKFFSKDQTVTNSR